ncbi:MAG: hypothetical protein JXA13_00300, partial [Anaerolineales bacterium]|nr:hypothetical protein [Anaerolineales bacterium]
MRRIVKFWHISLILLLVLLSACTIGQQPADAEPTLDMAAVQAFALQTVSANMTETAISFSPTPLPPTAAPTMTLIPTFAALATPFGATADPALVPPTLAPLTPGAAVFPTATPLVLNVTPQGPRCDDSAFVADVTYLDGSEFEGGTDFEKTWSIQNTGTCTWDDGFALVHVTGESLKGGNYEFDETSKFVEPGEI